MVNLKKGDYESEIVRATHSYESKLKEVLYYLHERLKQLELDLEVGAPDFIKRADQCIEEYLKSGEI
jgi:hypothetical protein